MKYAEIQKKFSLPPEEELEASFDIEIKESKYISREILKKIDEKFEYLCEKIQAPLHSDSNLESFYECNFVDEKEKEQLFQIFKAFMGKRREIFGKSMDFSEEQNCRLINDCHKIFSENKKYIEQIFSKIGRKWVEKDNQRKEAAGYFG